MNQTQEQILFNFNLWKLIIYLPIKQNKKQYKTDRMLSVPPIYIYINIFFNILIHRTGFKNNVLSSTYLLDQLLVKNILNLLTYLTIKKKKKLFSLFSRIKRSLSLSISLSLCLFPAFEPVIFMLCYN